MIRYATYTTHVYQRKYYVGVSGVSDQRRIDVAETKKKKPQNKQTKKKPATTTTTTTTTNGYVMMA